MTVQKANNNSGNPENTRAVKDSQARKMWHAYKIEERLAEECVGRTHEIHEIYDRKQELAGEGTKMRKQIKVSDMQATIVNSKFLQN